jgi:hypothetical protein
MRFALLALAVLLATTGCGSTKAAATGPCPERNEPLAGAMCSAEGTQCEYVVGTCTTDAYVCTAGKWTMMSTADAAGECPRPPRTGFGDAAADGDSDAASDAPSDAASD